MSVQSASRRRAVRGARRTVQASSAVRIPTADVAGIPVAVTDLDQAVDWLTDWVREGRGGIGVRLVNAFSVVSAHQDRRYLEVMRSRGVSLPDGVPVALALRLLAGQPRARRVRGPSLFAEVLQRGRTESGRHFFLGTTDATLERLRRAILAGAPGLPVAGTYAPPFGAPDDDFIRRCAEHVRAARADCVWVALGTPKQDFVADRLALVLGVPCIAVGAAFDYTAGTKREAPRLLQRVGAEWLYRLVSEPHRLWRRYLIGNVRFLLLLVRLRDPSLRGAR